MLKNQPRKHSVCCNPEDMCEHLHTFDFNPEGEGDDRESVIKQALSIITKCFFIAIFSEWVCDIWYTIEMSRMGRWHIHGFIKPIKVLDTYKGIGKLMKYTTFKIDTIKHLNERVRYRTKQWALQKREHITPYVFCNNKKLKQYIDGIIENIDSEDDPDEVYCDCWKQSYKENIE